MSSSAYPILDNRPIDKWKVTELKEELKKRKLTTRGLKEDLIKRLDEALRVERENDEIITFTTEEMSPKLGQTTPITAEPTPEQANEKGNDGIIIGSGLDNVKDETDKVESGIIAVDPLVSEGRSNDMIHKSGMDLENKGPSTRLVNDDDSKLQPETEPASNIQDSEVSPVTGLEVKSDCISTDSMSNNGKIELKDNVIADNVKLEHNDNVKLEHNDNESKDMVEESSSLEQKASVEDREKLNLDRSSGDESIEEEEANMKLIESNNSDELVNKIDQIKVPAVDSMKKPIEIVGSGKRDLHESQNQALVNSEKRKLSFIDQENGGNNEAVKRQRRWNSENIKVVEVETDLQRDFSRSDSTANEDGSKERVVPPSEKEPTNSLKIDRFLRPFTLKAVQELLGKTGTVTNFWMDHIKTHCYVSYSSIEEAMATRNAIYNLQWPSNGGRLLVAEFVDLGEVMAKIEANQPNPPLISLPLPPPPPPLPLSNSIPASDRLQPPPPPPPSGVTEQQQEEPPIVTLDDMFRKTKATPRIYYLPLSEDQVAAKVAAA